MPRIIIGNDLGSWDAEVSQEQLDELLSGADMSDEICGCDGECEDGRRNCGHATWWEPAGITN